MLRTSGKGKENKGLGDKERDRDDWIWDDDSNVATISSYMMPYEVESKEERPAQSQSQLTQIKENDLLTMGEKKKATHLTLTFADVFATKA